MIPSNGNSMLALVKIIPAGWNRSHVRRNVGKFSVLINCCLWNSRILISCHLLKDVEIRYFIDSIILNIDLKKFLPWYKKTSRPHHNQILFQHLCSCLLPHYSHLTQIECEPGRSLKVIFYSTRYCKKKLTILE